MPHYVVVKTDSATFISSEHHSRNEAQGVIDERKKYKGSEAVILEQAEPIVWWKWLAMNEDKKPEKKHRRRDERDE